MGTGDAPRRSRLAELTITDFAIIDRLHIEWGPGLNVLTGETGAGKSIIVDALGAALGDRADASWLRAGAERATVEALFETTALPPDFSALLAESGLDADEDLILTRDVATNRSVSRVNGRALPSGVVQRLAERLVDVHSQASHLSLLRVREHLALLDRLAQVSELRAQMTAGAREIRRLRFDIQQSAERSRQVEREISLLRHELEEIDAAALDIEEEASLVARRARLQNALRLREFANAAHDALQGSDESQGALELLETATQLLAEIKSLDSTLSVDSGRLMEAIDAAEDAARDLRRYAETIEDEPQSLEALEERLFLIADLKRKYGATIGDILAYRADAARRIDEFEHRDERLGELRAAESRAASAATRTALLLSAERAWAARVLEAEVERELADLGMPGARFVVAMTRQDASDGLTLEEGKQRVAFDESGIDHVEFLISPNAGEPPRPLARIASGGELARIMLAVKSVLVSVNATPVLIFDEFDQGVGGRMGNVIGEKLWRLARNHQVVCITHLAQVAAYGDTHYVVRKEIASGRTTTAVEMVADGSRVTELAAMLSGSHPGAAARRSAEELLEQAAARKQA